MARVRSSTLHIRAGVGLEWAERLLQAHESFPRFGMDKALSNSRTAASPVDVCHMTPDLKAAMLQFTPYQILRSSLRNGTY